MHLKEIYRPIKKELIDVEQVLKTSLKDTKHKSILKITDYLLDAKGKRIRAALVVLCAKASQKLKVMNQNLIKIAAAMELIHSASLIHDDVIDHAILRHNKPTINSKWGQDVSIALGDYLYSEAFRLVSECENADIIRCISQATKSMCEGELLQVCERDRLDLLKERYIVVVKKKTASLFAASCQAGTMLVSYNRIIQEALKEYGLNFGVAFQIVDDCMDLIGDIEDLGKTPGADFRMGELTLPVLNLLSVEQNKNRIISLVKKQHSQDAFKELKERFINSEAFLKTKKDACFYIQKAKKNLNNLKGSCFKESLFALADYLTERVKL